MMKLAKDYVDGILIRATHHSLAIENNTMTLNEAVSILLYNTISADVSIREFYEVDNHKMAFNYLIQNLDQELVYLLSGFVSYAKTAMQLEKERYFAFLK